jgi:hypothetical protein
MAQRGNDTHMRSDEANTRAVSKAKDDREWAAKELGGNKLS